MRLGEQLLRDGLVTAEGLEEALEAQVVHGGRLGTNLVELGLLSEQDLAKSLGKLHNSAFASGEMVPDPKALELVSANHADDKEYLPMRVDATRLSVAVVNPHDFTTLDAIAFRTGKRVVPVVIPEFRMNQLLRRYCKAFRPLRAIDMNAVRPRPAQGSQAELAKAAEKPPDLMSEEEFQSVYASALRGGADYDGDVGEEEIITGVEVLEPAFVAPVAPSMTPPQAGARPPVHGAPPQMAQPPVPPPGPIPPQWAQPPASPPGPVPLQGTQPPASPPGAFPPPIAQPPASPPGHVSLQGTQPPASPPGIAPSPMAQPPASPPGIAPSPMGQPPASPPGMVPSPMAQPAVARPGVVPPPVAQPPFPSPGIVAPPLAHPAVPSQGLGVPPQSPVPSQGVVPPPMAQPPSPPPGMAFPPQGGLPPAPPQSPTAPMGAALGGPPPAAHVQAPRPPEPPPTPLTFAEAQAELARSSDREDVARTVLRFALGKWKRNLLLSVQGSLVTGWHGMGTGVRDAVVRRIGVPLREQSTFRLVRDTRSHYIGPVRRDAAMGMFYKLLGGGFPTTAVILPLLVRGKVVHLLYVDNGPDQVTPPDVGELLILSQSVGRSYEAMMRRRKSA
ncbi:hypothetical protein [Myxococcus sp. Y35]|uniref:GspE/PulE/PilB domain-containing protein n=1 Tax=Pseudomyxococcus flavus TaxID=3115648 RepID=UPI003CEA7DE6